jgi:predicted ATPase
MKQATVGGTRSFVASRVSRFSVSTGYEGQRALEAALRLAQRQQAKAYELRAAMSMARLWRDQGKRDEARDLLAPVYGWFTEGFETLDLKGAKALLDELTA